MESPSFEPDGEASDLGLPEGWRDLAGVPDDVDLVLEVDTMMAVYAAMRYRRIDEFRVNTLVDAERTGERSLAIVERSIRLELAAAMRTTEHAAQQLLAEAKSLVHEYPAVLESLESARITAGHAAVMVTALDVLEPQLRDEVAERGLVLAEALPVGTFRTKLRKLVALSLADTLPERHQRALGGRRIAIEPAHDGMAWLDVLMPAVEAHAIHARITAKGKAILAGEGETRTLDQVRADIVADLLIDGETESTPPSARGIRATVAVTVPVLALLGDESTNSGIAVVEGIGPVPTDRARDLCGGADGWMRVLTHPETGVVLSVGRDLYRPPPELRRLVRWRAETCMAPGCNMPARRCEIDHNVAWEDGGETRLENLCPFCKGHHTIKHHGGWCVEQPDDGGGAILWTSPTGRRYRVEPERPLALRAAPVFVASGEPTGASAPF